jgi:hypothetical protein
MNRCDIGLPALGLIAALGSTSAELHADTGTVVFASGQVTLTKNSSGRAVRLAKGDAVGVGALLRTGQGQLQVRFPDGTYVSVGPGSYLRVDAYRYATRSDGSDAAFFTLYRGEVRFLTGAIADSPNRRFRLNTPFATLHSGSAEFSALVGGGLQVSLGAGSAEIRNQAGALRLAAGERGFVSNREAPPILVGTIVPAPVAPR